MLMSYLFSAIYLPFPFFGYNFNIIILTFNLARVILAYLCTCYKFILFANRLINDRSCILSNKAF